MQLKSSINQNVEMVKARVERVGYELYSIEEVYADAKKVLEEIEETTTEMEFIYFYHDGTGFKVIRSEMMYDSDIEISTFKKSLLEDGKTIKTYKHLNRWTDLAYEYSKLNRFYKTFVMIQN
jgi:hypothetical protein